MADKGFADADAVAVADLVTTILLTVNRTGRLTELPPWWDQLLVTREVHQATGMIVAQPGVTARDAYVRMQARAYAEGLLLNDVANDVVNRRLRFDPDPDAVGAASLSDESVDPRDIRGTILLGGMSDGSL